MQSGSDAGCRHTRQAILEYVCGELRPDQAAEVEAHISACRACRAREAFERQLRDRLQELRVAPVPSRLKVRVDVILADAPTR